MSDKRNKNDHSESSYGLENFTNKKYKPTNVGKKNRQTVTTNYSGDRYGHKIINFLKIYNVISIVLLITILPIVLYFLKINIFLNILVTGISAFISYLLLSIIINIMSNIAIIAKNSDNIIDELKNK